MNNFIPHFIKKQYSENKLSGEFKAYIMYVDFIDFSTMTEKFMGGGKEGVEILTEIINKVFTPSIKAIYKNGGFISSFAGDAFTALFHEEKVDILQSCQSALNIMDFFKKIGSKKTKFGKFNLSAKIAISSGIVNWDIMKNKHQNIFYFYGEGIKNVVECIKRSGAGEIIISKEIAAMDSNCTLKEKEDNYFLLQKTQKLKEISKKTKTKFIDLKIDDDKKWLPDVILKSREIGEFRDIVSCYISFKENEGMYSNLNEIINLAHKYGGYLNKVDYGDKGWIALVLFGAPIGLEKIYVRSCDFALAVRDIDTIEVKIGITYGTSFCGIIGSKERSEYTALGMVVNLSTRLAMIAKWNDIYIDSNIKKKIQNNYRIDFVSSKKLKGFTYDVEVFKLNGKEIDKISDRFFYDSNFIGRKEELKKIKDFTKPIDNNKFGGIIYIYGEAGIGKSRLINEYQQLYCHDERYNWFYMSCDEILRKPFNPVICFLREYFKQRDSNSNEENKLLFEEGIEKLKVNLSLVGDSIISEIQNELIRTKSILGALLDLKWKDSLYETLDPKRRHENTRYALKNLIKAESLIKPVIIELEDGHWIDDDTRDFLEFLVRNVNNYPFIIITECRYSDYGEEIKFNFCKDNENIINLRYLDNETAKELIKSLIKDKFNIKSDIKISDKAFKLVLEKSEGNPFYLEQIILYLIEKKYLDRNLNISSDSFDIPPNINMIITTRIDRLASELKGIIKTAAVLGFEFDVEILARIIEKLNVSFDLSRALKIAEKENIWKTIIEMKYIFKHALIRDSIYQMQLKSQLRELHRLAAETIIELHGNENSYYFDIANHYEKAEEYRETIFYLEKTADYYKSKYQNKLALEFYQKLLDKINEEKSSIKIIEILIKRNNILRIIGKWHEAEDECLKAMDLSNNIDDVKISADIMSNYAMVLILLGKYYESIDYNNRALKIYEKLQDKQGISDVIGGIANVYATMTKYEKAMGFYKKKLQIDKELGNKINMTKTIGNIGVIYFHRNEREKALEYYEKSLVLYKEINNIWGISKLHGNIAIVYADQGKFDDAIELYNKSLQIKYDLCDKKGISTIYGNLGNVYQKKGKFDKAMDCYYKSLSIKEELGDERGKCVIYLNFGQSYNNIKDHEKAIKYYDMSIKISRKLEFNYFLCRSLSLKAETCFDLKQYKLSEELNNETLEIARNSYIKDLLFDSKVLKEMIRHKIEDDKLNSAKVLKDMLSCEKDKERKARLNKELFYITDEKIYQNESLRLYEEIFKTKPNIQFKTFIKELKRENK